MLYPRRLQPELIKQIDTKEAVALTGMRRVGKTTLLSQVLEDIPSTNKAYLDLENPLNRRVFEKENYDNIWADLQDYGINTSEKAYLFLDEIQFMPQVVSIVKYLYDHYQTKFFLTGSSSFYLKNLFMESLAGRKVIFELFPLDFQEFLVFKEYAEPEVLYKTQPLIDLAKNKNEVGHKRRSGLYEEYLRFGGFPGVVVESDVTQKKRIIEDILTAYFEIDVQTLADFREMGALRDLIILLMERVGSKLDISKISSEIGVSRPTIYSYLNFLEKTYFIRLLSPFSRSVDREVSGQRKVYLADTGLLHQLGKKPIRSGELLENAVLNNLRKYSSKQNYYERRRGGEIDFILNQQTGVEVKQTAAEKDQRKLEKLSQDLDLKQHYLVSQKYAGLPSVIPATSL